MTSSAPPPRVRCRPIGESDLVPVVDLLRQGFPGRSRRYWMRGFGRQAARALPPGVPRYGFLLESEGCPVGVILLLYTALGSGPQAELRCNLSSWYVDPEFRSQASPLIFAAPARY